MTPQDEFAESAAAYVLGALPLDERHAFEQHLRDCADCTRAVSELAGIPALLRRAQLPDTAGEAPGPVPAAVLSGLAARVAGHRRRTRIVLGGVAGAAACLVAALLVVLALLAPAGGEIGGTPSAEPVAMTELAGTPMHVTASLRDAAWGTRIDLNCSYDAGVDVRDVFYALRVTGKDGQAQQVATWLGVPGRVSTVGAATSLRPGEIEEVEVVTQSGRPVLRLPR